jgi:hypothetical protein
VKTLQCLLASLLVLSTQSQAQDAKRQLRDFSPKYTIDTFHVAGESSSLKRKVIQMLLVNGIRSAFWDNESGIATVQYDNKLIKLPMIKKLFTSNKNIPEQYKVQQLSGNTLLISGILPNNSSKSKNK